jgi:hypothetical protein
MAKACLALIEAGVFPRGRTETVRMLLNSVPACAESHVAELQKRLLAAER